MIKYLKIYFVIIIIIIFKSISIFRMESENFYDLSVFQSFTSHETNTGSYDNENFSPLHIAALNGQLAIVKHLISLGENIDCKSINDETPLYAASQNGHLEVVKYLISKGANIDCKTVEYVTPLNIASQKGYLDIVKYLILQEANIESKDIQNKTPLLSALLNGHINIVQYLISQGANINCRNKKFETPIFYLKNHKQKFNEEDFITKCCHYFSSIKDIK